jgi:curved DNA-binding protein CbpA
MVSVGNGGQQDLYAVLGVAPDATSDEIARAFRERAKRLHPDVSQEPHAEAAFKDLVAANEILSNPAARAEYDRSRAPGPPMTSAAYRYPAYRRRSRSTLPIILAAVACMIVLLIVFASLGKQLGNNVTDPGTSNVGTRVLATRIVKYGVPYVRYFKPDGTPLEFPDPTPQAGSAPVGSSVYVRYLQNYPELGPLPDTPGRVPTASDAHKVLWLTGLGTAIILGTGALLRYLSRRRKREPAFRY